MQDKDFSPAQPAEGLSYPVDSRQGYGLTMDLGWNRMLIHKKTIRALGYPAYVRLLINPAARHLCVQGCDGNEPCSFAVPGMQASVLESFYIHSKFLLGQVCALMSWDPAMSYRVYGKINTQANIMVFDLNRFVEWNLSDYLENDEVPEEFMEDYIKQTDTDDVGKETPSTQPQDNAQALPQNDTRTAAGVPPAGRFAGWLFDSVRLPDTKDEHRYEPFSLDMLLSAVRLLTSAMDREAEGYRITDSHTVPGRESSALQVPAASQVPRMMESLCC